MKKLLIIAILICNVAHADYEKFKSTPKIEKAITEYKQSLQKVIPIFEQIADLENLPENYKKYYRDYATSRKKHLNNSSEDLFQNTFIPYAISNNIKVNNQTFYESTIKVINWNNKVSNSPKKFSEYVFDLAKKDKPVLKGFLGQKLKLGMSLGELKKIQNIEVSRCSDDYTGCSIKIGISNLDNIIKKYMVVYKPSEDLNGQLDFSEEYIYADIELYQNTLTGMAFYVNADYNLSEFYKNLYDDFGQFNYKFLKDNDCILDEYSRIGIVIESVDRKNDILAFSSIFKMSLIAMNPYGLSRKTTPKKLNSYYPEFNQLK